MSYLVILILILLTTTGIVGQEITFDQQRMTSCSEGLIAGTDKYIINGTAGSVPALDTAGWESSVHFGNFTSTSQFAEFCQINIGRTGIFCQPPYTPPCYCYQFDAATGVGHFFVNYTARLVDRQLKLIFMWQHTNGTRVYSPQNISLPAIYDVSNADLKLKVTDTQVNVENGDSCDRSFTAGIDNTVQLCCNKTASPCYPRIAFNGSIVAQNQSGCVSYTVTSPSDNYTVNITKSYSVCTQSDYITAGSCIMNTSLATTTAPTTTTGVESPTLPPSNSSSSTDVVTTGKTNDTGLTSGQIFGVSFGTIGGIIVIVIIVVCYCKEKNATLVCCCCCTEKGISIYCCCYDGKIVSTACCSCKPLSNGGNKDKANEENPESGGTNRPGAGQPENTSNTGAKRSKNDTSGSGTPNVELMDIETKKKDAPISNNGQNAIVPSVDSKHATRSPSAVPSVSTSNTAAKRSKNATSGSELQSEEMKDNETKKNEAPSSKTGQTSAKGPRYNSQRTPSSS